MFQVMVKEKKEMSKKPRMEWWRLRHGKCPKCQGFLQSIGNSIVEALSCPKCGFRIGNKKAQDIIQGVVQGENSKGNRKR